jgi:phosphoribosylglycinamide formyltransferase-1
MHPSAAGPDDALVRAASDAVQDIFSALPGVCAARAKQHTRFSVRGRTVAYLLVDHHGDGILGLVVKAAAGENRALVRRDAELYYIPAYLGSRGWVGIRLDVDGVPWDVVDDFIWASYRLVAPKSLAREPRTAADSQESGGRCP